MSGQEYQTSPGDATGSADELVQSPVVGVDENRTSNFDSSNVEVNKTDKGKTVERMTEEGADVNTDVAMLNADESSTKSDDKVQTDIADHQDKPGDKDTNEEAKGSEELDKNGDTANNQSDELKSGDNDNKEAKDSAYSDLGATAAVNDAQCSPGDSIYHIKWIYFKKKLVPIITQNENGPCPLLAILNVLLLQARVKIQAKTEVVTANQLMTYLGDCVLENVPSGSDEGMAASARLNFEQNMQDTVAVMYKLQTGIDVNVKFTGIKDFEYTPECIIFDLLQISLYHGWLVDPQNQGEVQAVGACSYNQLVEKIIVEKSSDQTEVVSQALLAEQFLESSASQLTYHGLCELSSQLKEDELVVLFRNNHFITLYRHNNELFQLVTDQGFLHESNVVWETLSNVEGDCHFVDSEFRTYTKPEPAYNPAENTEQPHLSPNEQIEQDFMVALSLQQEQQDQMVWAQVDPQQPPALSDLELARSLQEEERRAAAAEQERNQRQQQPAGNQQNSGHMGHRQPQRVEKRQINAAEQERNQRQHQQPAGNQQNSGHIGHRQPQRVESREKKSDCCIL